MASPKRCNRCGEVKGASQFYRRSNRPDGLNHACKACEATLDRERTLRYRYGLTPDEYASLLAQQNGGCGICGAPPGKKPLHVDHEHSSGQIRGLLCARCNLAIGYFGDSAERMYCAIEYLVRRTGLSVPMTEQAKKHRKESN